MRFFFLHTSSSSSILLYLFILLPFPKFFHSDHPHPPPVPFFAHALPISMLYSYSSGRLYPFINIQRPRPEEKMRMKMMKEEEEEGEGEDEEEGDEQLEKDEKDQNQLLEARIGMEEATTTTEKTPSGVKFGTLKLCPPGGRSFFEAYELACPMRRKKRGQERGRTKRHALFGLGELMGKKMRRRRGKWMIGREEDERDERMRKKEDKGHEQERAQGGRPANITEIMHICCARGCEITDFFPHCGPFSVW